MSSARGAGMPDILTRLQNSLGSAYTVERELGRGGMATVYLAEDRKHGRKVAIKVLSPEFGAALGPERFLREIAITARLAHPHIMPVHDSGNAGGLLFYVMPFIGGESLRERLRRDGQLPVDEALRITRRVADALGFAHRQGLVHRDIKPENILLEAGHPVLSDFGIALAATPAGGERLTATGLSLGTPAYMSPEQAMGEPNTDARSDIYSLACLLYEMLAGEAPFRGPTAQSLVARHLTAPVPGIRRIRPAVPAAVEQAIIKALAKAPADRFATAEAFAAALARPASSLPLQPSVAVLPFRNLSADPDNEFFADGITEDVIAQLSKIRSMKVISRTSVMPFKNTLQSLGEIGAILGVATLLQGSVRRAGDRVRIVAQLIDAERDEHLWTETYDRQLTDIFAIQTDVALAISGALKAELSHDERSRLHEAPTRNLHAYQLYVQGRQCYGRFTEDEMQRAVEYYRRALVLDPGYALPYVGIAQIFAERGMGQGGGAHRPEESFRQASEAVNAALAIDPALGEAHSVCGLLKFVQRFDWAGAEAEFKMALELSPGSSDTYDQYGRCCAAQGRYDEAVVLTRRAHELDPLMHRADLASALLRAGRTDEALAAGRECIEFEPDYARGRSTLGWACLLTGSVTEGLAELERSAALSPGDTMYLAQLGQGYAMAGRTDEAHAILRRLDQLAAERYVSPYHLAYIHTGLGDQDRAMDLLERAYEERAGGVYGIKGSFLFTSLRSNPRFGALLRKMNLTP